jgi:two-component system, chemotaxis family, response regulator Rcp1
MANATIKKGSGSRAIRILLVEDDAGDVYLLEKTLNSRNLTYELLRYADGEDAIHALEKDDCTLPDLIILDLNLPRRGGFDVLQAIRRKPSMVGVPVGILTSSDAVKDRHRIAVTGDERYIHKPPELEDFLDQVGRAIEDLLAKRSR